MTPLAGTNTHKMPSSSAHRYRNERQLLADFCLWWPAENAPLLPVVTGSKGPISLIRCVGSRGCTSL